MKNNDAQLIQRVLKGDDTAFSALVKKYQRSVHALAWRKIGDFHIAEDITQDTFLQAYQRLSTLKEPQRFASWLYVIAANYCQNVAPEETFVNAVVGKHKQRAIRKSDLFWTCYRGKRADNRQNHSARSLRSCLRSYKRVNARSSRFITSGK